MKKRSGSVVQLNNGVALACLLMAGMPTVAQAQTADTPTAPVAPIGDDAAGQEIVVTGIRGSLESAIQQRRRANSIIDSISADDLGDIPDQDLGEALQRIPGVQIERGPNSERRSSSVSVRGLPSIFTKSTLLGQNIASASAVRFYVQPFGIYDSSIFTGLSVIKSLTADLQSGGIAGNVDFQISSALSRRESASIRAELSYEELPQAVLPGVFATGTKHFADGDFGVHATVAYARQKFRRDIISITSYEQLPQAQLAALVGPALPAGAVGLYPGTIRQSVEQNKGDRISASAGFEWRISDGLRLRADGIFSRRSLPDSLLDDFQVDALGPGEVVTPVGDPVDLGVIDTNYDGRTEQAYLFPRVNFSNYRYQPGNRLFAFYEQSFAVIPQLNYADDDWQVNLIGGYSDASNKFDQRGFTVSAPSTATGNGVTGSIFTGLGDIRDFQFDVRPPAGLINFQAGPWTLDAAGTSARNPIGNVFSLLTNTQLVERDLHSLQLDFERRLDLALLSSVKLGARYQKDGLKTQRQGLSLIGTDLAALTNAVLIPNTGIRAGDDFFGGIVDGIERDDFLSLDLDRLEEQLLPRSGDCGPRSAPNKFVPQYCQVNGLPNFNALNFTASRKQLEAFAMVNLSLEDWLNLPVRGNAGLRWSFYDIKGALISTPDVTLQSERDKWLPSVNLIADLTDRLVLNAAYYKSFEAYDLGRFSPVGTTVTDQVVSVDVFQTQFNFEPREADSFDLGLSWYNRAGSILAVNLFHKKLTSEDARTEQCPAEGIAGFAPLVLAANGACRIGSATGRPILVVNFEPIAKKTRVNGVELQASQDLGFLNSWLRGFGAVANYTILDIDVPPGATLFAVSERTLNLIGYYEREEGSIRLAYNHRSPELLTASANPVFGPSRVNQARGQFDLSVRVTPVRTFDVRLEVFNLTNARRQEFQADPRLIRRADYDGRVLKLSLQKSF